MDLYIAWPMSALKTSLKFLDKTFSLKNIEESKSKTFHKNVGVSWAAMSGATQGSWC